MKALINANATEDGISAEDLEPIERQHIEEALLRYCELDTFAMVMIVEAWREWVVSR